ncbi:MAG: hypothetical protein DRJ51_09035 [Thermoprotei archaeon]|nr:MAG: hypothetical protein DRJ51_09035 [Thermoprotei archaeon]RLE99748.1 MAG: hypothetical protein DRJ59_07755 [Thermoprotei archaeon]
MIGLSEDEAEYYLIYNSSLEKRIRVPVSKAALEFDFRISVCRPKTRDTVIVTLSIKNMVMGAVQSPYKTPVHQGYAAINLSIADLAEHLMPT